MKKITTVDIHLPPYWDRFNSQLLHFIVWIECVTFSTYVVVLCLNHGTVRWKFDDCPLVFAWSLFCMMHFNPFQNFFNWKSKFFKKLFGRDILCFAVPRDVLVSSEKSLVKILARSRDSMFLYLANTEIFNIQMWQIKSNNIFSDFAEYERNLP